jgi:hypothetical protein
LGVVQQPAPSHATPPRPPHRRPGPVARFRTCHARRAFWVGEPAKEARAALARVGGRADTLGGTDPRGGVACGGDWAGVGWVIGTCVYLVTYDLVTYELVTLGHCAGRVIHTQGASVYAPTSQCMQPTSPGVSVYMPVVENSPVGHSTSTSGTAAAAATTSARACVFVVFFAGVTVNTTTLSAASFCARGVRSSQSAVCQSVGRQLPGSFQAASRQLLLLCRQRGMVAGRWQEGGR